MSAVSLKEKIGVLICDDSAFSRVTLRKIIESEIGKTADHEKIVSAPPAEAKDGTGRLGFKLVALGISTGGPRTIFHVLPVLPKDLNAAVIVVQHMPVAFIPPFTQRLALKSAMKCVETEAGMKVEPGIIYVATGGYHLKLVKKINGDVLIRQTKEPQHLFMPSIDIMMDSAADIFGPDTVGVLMTGMGRDGAEGMVKIKEAGGMTIAESEETAVVFGMPQEAINRGGVRVVLPDWAIAREIVKAVEGKK